MGIFCVVVCDRCGYPQGDGDVLWIDEGHARNAADHDDDWRRIDDEDVCLDCSIKEAMSDDYSDA